MSFKTVFLVAAVFAYQANGDVLSFVQPFAKGFKDGVEDMAKPFVDLGKEYLSGERKPLISKFFGAASNFVNRPTSQYEGIEALVTRVPGSGSGLGFFGYRPNEPSAQYQPQPQYQPQYQPQPQFRPQPQVQISPEYYPQPSVRPFPAPVPAPAPAPAEERPSQPQQGNQVEIPEPQPEEPEVPFVVQPNVQAQPALLVSAVPAAQNQE